MPLHPKRKPPNVEEIENETSSVDSREDRIDDNRIGRIER